MTDLARRLRGVEGRLEFKRWDVGTIAFPDEWFDTIITSFAFHRYVNPVATLLEMRRVLRPGGQIYILEPDRMSFGGLFALWDYYFRLTDPGHVRYYTPTAVLRLLQRAGFAGERELDRYQRLLSGGKLLASAVFLNARRDQAHPTNSPITMATPTGMSAPIGVSDRRVSPSPEEPEARP
jgi:SAM-dependent methyltransferase